MPKRKASDFLAARDHNGRTCLKVGEADGQVEYIPLNVVDGFQVERTSSQSFNQRYQPMPDYPVGRACQLYLTYCLTVGGTPEVLDRLGEVIPITNEEREMATSKREQSEAKPTKRTAAKQPAAKQPAAKQPAEKPAARAKAATKPKPAVKPAAKPKRPSAKAKDQEYSSAAQMFKDLIMAGKQTDDEIFAAVQQAFGLPDNKRSYVKWYRNNLKKKKGENPPEAQ